MKNNMDVIKRVMLVFQDWNLDVPAEAGDHLTREELVYLAEQVVAVVKEYLDD